VGQAIATVLANRTFVDGDPMVLHESRQIPSGRVINVQFAGRTNQDVAIAAISGGQQNALRAEFTVDIYQSGVDATEAARLRNRMLDEVEVALMGDRTLSGAVAHLEIGEVTLVEQAEDRNHWAMAALRVYTDKTVTTQ